MVIQTEVIKRILVKQREDSSYYPVVLSENCAYYFDEFQGHGTVLLTLEEALMVSLRNGRIWIRIAEDRMEMVGTSLYYAPFGRGFWSQQLNEKLIKDCKEDLVEMLL